MNRILLIAIATALGGSGLYAQTLPELRDQLRDGLRFGIGRFSGAVISLNEVPDLATARFEIDQDDGSSLELTTFKVPLEFDLVEFGPCDTLFLETGLGYLEADFSTVEFPNAMIGPSFASSEISVFSGEAGIGVRQQITDDLSISPIVGLGWSRIESEATYSGPDAATVQQIFDGIVFNWTAKTIDYSAGLRAEYDHHFHNELRIQASSRFVHEHSRTYQSTDVAQDFDVDSNVLPSRAVLSGPTGWEPGDSAVRWLAIGGHTWLPGSTGSALGFHYYSELGAGFEWGAESLGLPIDTVRLTGSYFIGPDVDGWSFGLGVSLRF